MIQSDVNNSLVYPELSPIRYFENNLFQYECNNPEFSDCIREPGEDEALNRLSALLHETFVETVRDIQLINFLPNEKEGFIIDNAPNGKKSETELTIHINPEEQYWLFHDGTPVTVEDIYYSIKYARIGKNSIPDLYSTGQIRMSLFKEENKLKILYKFQIPRPLIINHFNNLIILPAKIIKAFVDTGGNNKNILINTYVRDENNPAAIQSVNASGPFKVHGNQSKKALNLKLDRFENYGRYFSSNADMELINIRRNDKQGDWFELLKKGEYNLAINISSASQSHKKSGVKVRKLGSFEVASLTVNHSNKYLKQKLFREAISIAIDKPFIRKQIFKSKVQLISGPFSKKEDSFTGFKIEYNENKFHEIMNSLGYTRKDKFSDYKDSDNRFIELDILYYNSKKDKNNNTTNQLIDQIILDLKDLGLKVNKVSKETLDGIQKALSEKDFDLYYNVARIKTNENVDEYYSVDGYKNYGNYIPSQELDKKIISLSGDCGGPELCKIKKEEVWNKLAKDYANIFLWSPDYFYAYNKNYINISKFFVNSDQFFLEPHNWDIFPDEQDE